MSQADPRRSRIIIADIETTDVARPGKIGSIPSQFSPPPNNSQPRLTPPASVIANGIPLRGTRTEEWASATGSSSTGVPTLPR